jgi:hypothetical protein
MTKSTEVAVSTQAKENMYLVIVEGFQLLSQWTGWVWEQSAWKFSRPAKEWSPFDTDHSKDVSDYEKVIATKTLYNNAQTKTYFCLPPQIIWVKLSSFQTQNILEFVSS